MNLTLLPPPESFLEVDVLEKLHRKYGKLQMNMLAGSVLTEELREGNPKETKSRAFSRKRKVALQDEIGFHWREMAVSKGVRGKGTSFRAPRRG